MEEFTFRELIHLQEEELKLLEFLVPDNRTAEQASGSLLQWGAESVCLLYLPSR